MLERATEGRDCRLTPGPIPFGPVYPGALVHRERRNQADRPKSVVIEPRSTRLSSVTIAPEPSFVASVVVPVKNAGPRLGSVVEAIAGQETMWPFEVLFIDSGSTDGSLERLRAACERPNWRVLEIPPQDFAHGRTRNLGVNVTKGEFVAFLTHDAIPADASWLCELVEPLQQDARVAGVFGRHIAHIASSPFLVDELDGHFEQFRAEPVTWLEDQSRYDADERYRQFLHFFSSNNACIRRSIWETIPFPEVEFAEDQAWAKAVIEAGWKRAYTHRATVRHSHDFGTIETLRRAFDESRSFRRHFGYRMATNPLGIARTTFGLSRRDLRTALEKHYWRTFPGATVRRPWLHLAKATGHFLGSHEQRLPQRLANGLSLDRRLKVGLR